MSLQSIGSFLYRGAVTGLQATGVTTACAAAQAAIYTAGDWVGRKTAALTGGRVTLSNMIPEVIKAPCRELGDFLLLRVTFPFSDRLPNLGGTPHSPASHTVVACPVTEEVVYRLPLVLLFDQVGSTPTGLAIKAGATLLSSVAFTYGHERASGVAPHNPGRALGLLASGVGYALIATQIGFGTAVAAHALYNVSSYF